MNLVSRARLSGRIRLSSLYSTSSLQQWNSSYSTSRTPKSTNPNSPKSPAPPSSVSVKMKKPTGEAIVWPKPCEIPYQPKVANFVTLIGYVKAPVQFESTPDGFSAATAISQDFTGGNDSLLIPLVFEGDLAHVVATHVKENNCVLVSGQLSSEPSRFQLKEGFGKFHLLCEDLNFVQGFQSGSPRMKSVGVKKADDGGLRNVVDGVSDDKFHHETEKASEEAKLKKSWGEENRGRSSVSLDSVVGSKGAMWGSEPTIVRGEGPDSGDKKKEGNKKFLGEENWGPSSVSLDSNVGSKAATWGAGEPTIERGKEPGSGDSGDKKKDRAESGVKKKDGDQWRDLVRNSPNWLDFRDQKAKGLKGAKFPDFKHKQTGDALWINSAPTWVLPGIEKLAIDVPANPVQRNQGSGENTSHVNDDLSWKDLVENPSKWWDNRTNKLYPNAPDFKHKETKQGLWLNRSPDWALSKLPPLN